MKRRAQQPDPDTWTRRTALHCERPGVGWIEGVAGSWVFHPENGGATSTHGSLADAQAFADRRAEKC